MGLLGGKDNSLLNLASNDLGDKLGNELLEVAGRGLTDHDWRGKATLVSDVISDAEWEAQKNSPSVILTRISRICEALA